MVRNAKICAALVALAVLIVYSDAAFAAAKNATTNKRPLLKPGEAIGINPQPEPPGGRSLAAGASTKLNPQPEPPIGSPTEDVIEVDEKTRLIQQERFENMVRKERSATERDVTRVGDAVRDR